MRLGFLSDMFYQHSFTLLESNDLWRLGFGSKYSSMTCYHNYNLKP